MSKVHERHHQAAALITQYGFVTDPSRANEVLRYRPFAFLSSPETSCTAAFGRIEAAAVSAFEYEYSSQDSNGNWSSDVTLAVVVEHPDIPGGAAIRPDWREWSTIGAFIDTVFWIPPFTILKVFQLLMQDQNPDRVVGHAEFDRLYEVRAKSNEAAARAIGPELRDLLPRIGFRGTLELRPSLAVFSIPGTKFDSEGIVRALGHVAPILAATARRHSYPMR
jgi:hypothetical protein